MTRTDGRGGPAGPAPGSARHTPGVAVDGWERPRGGHYRDAVTTIETPWQALRSRHYLLSSGPRRAILYGLTTLPLAGVAGVGLGTLILPWLAAGLRFNDGRVIDGPLLFVMVTALAMFAGAGPLVVIPLAAVERGRLALIDQRPVQSA